MKSVIVWIVATMIFGAVMGLAIHYALSLVIKVRPRDGGFDSKFKMK